MTISDMRKSVSDNTALILVVSFIGFASIVFRPTVVDMMSMWRISAYQHGWLVPWIALAILWLRRKHLQSAPFTIGWLGFVLLALSAFAWFVSIRTSVRAIEHLSFVAILVSAVFAIVGWPKFRQIMFPLGLLFAAVPIGDFMLPYLMKWTADISSGLLEVFGVPAWRQGMLITLPNGVFHVDEVCSGIRYLLASFVSSLLYSYFAFRSVAKRVLFVGVTVVSFVLLNGFRAFVTMIVANATDMKWFVGRDHIYFGGFLFFCLIVLLLFLAEKFSDKDLGVEPVEAPQKSETGRNGAGLRLAMVAAGIFVLPLWVLGGSSAAIVHTPLEVVSLSGCSAPEEWAERWQPEMVGASQTVALTYKCDAGAISLFAARYDDQTQGAELISRQNAYWPDHWDRIGTRKHLTASLDGQSQPFTELAVMTPEGSRVVWFTYVIGEKVTANEYMAKFWQAYYAVKGEQAPATLYLFSIGPDRSDDSLRQALEAHIALPR
jgi:exosortase A